MPNIYRMQCTACGKAPRVEGVLAGWVATDGREGGQILPDGYLALRLDNGEFKPLPHPAEASTLRQLGFTWTEASRQSRLFRVTFKICRKCGALYEERQHHDSKTGCLAAVISIPITVATLKFGFGRSWGLSLFSAYGVMLGVLGLVSLGNWLRWRKQNGELKLASCAKCQAKDFATIPKVARQVLMCSHCQTKNVHCNLAGLS
jgi:hypothetical protein